MTLHCEDEKSLTVAEAADAIGVSRTWIYRELQTDGLELASPEDGQKRVTAQSVRRRWIDRVERERIRRKQKLKRPHLRLVIDNT